MRALQQGGLVVYPTETSYALGADPRSAKGLKAIFEAKSRSKNMPLSLIASSVASAERLVRFSSKAKLLAAQHWPGPLTLVLPAKSLSLARRLGSLDGTVAVRVSSSPVAIALARRIGGAIVATSANKSGAGDSYDARAIEKFFAADDALIFFFSSGRLPRRLPSTIGRVVGDEVTVLRQGSISINF